MGIVVHVACVVGRMVLDDGVTVVLSPETTDDDVVHCDGDLGPGVVLSILEDEVG